jgi:hypothetical protein
MQKIHKEEAVLKVKCQSHFERSAVIYQLITSNLQIASCLEMTVIGTFKTASLRLLDVLNLIGIGGYLGTNPT